jgi:cell division protein FtsB
VASNSRLNQGNSRNWLLAGVVLLLIGVSSYLIFEFGRISAGYDTVDVAKERQALEERIMALDDQIVALKQEVALLETHREIDRAAYKEVETSLVSLQAKIQEQRDAIAFYRGIVSPADGKSGLRVQDLKLTRGNAEREFNLRLVLVQAKQHDRKVSGNVALSVQGSQDGVETVYTLKQLVPVESDAAWPFSFRYFQDFDRQLVLPDGFTPELIRVEVRSKTRSIQSIEESYTWSTSLDSKRATADNGILEMQIDVRQEAT